MHRVIDRLFFGSHREYSLKFSQPGIKNFPKSVYKADNQNWSIGQDGFGTLYFANNNGLLTFDGISWKTYPMPDEMIVRSLEVLLSGRIFAGSFEEFGYWEKDDKGELRYTSLKPMLKGFPFQNEEIRKIITWKGITCFQSFSVIFAYNSSTVRVINPPGFITCIARINHTLYLRISDHGLFNLRDYIIAPVDDADFFKFNMIRVILPFQQDKMLIATADNGIYVYETLGASSEDYLTGVLKVVK